MGNPKYEFLTVIGVVLDYTVRTENNQTSIVPIRNVGEYNLKIKKHSGLNGLSVTFSPLKKGTFYVKSSEYIDWKHEKIQKFSLLLADVNQ